MHALTEGIVNEYTYYMDDTAYVTNRRVKLDWAEYDLADIKWVGVEERVVGLRVGRFEIPSKFATIITSYLFLICLFILPVAFLPGDSHSIIRLVGYLVIGATHGLMMRWLGKRGYLQYWLALSGTFCRHYAMTSTQEQQVKHIVRAIKRAIHDR